MSTGRRFTITPRGAFSLQESAQFGFGQHVDRAWDGTMRLAFCLDGYREHAGVEVRQEGDAVRCVAFGSHDVSAIERQVARMLSLDADGIVYERIGDSDPVVKQLHAAAPGLRPPLFYSPYEAAVWAVMSARRPARQMAAVRRDLSEAHGAVFELAGQRTAALPTPGTLLSVASIPGLNAEKVDRLHGVAQAALRGLLDVDRLQQLGPDAALEEVQQLRGIGRFYAALIVIRGTGFVDVLPDEEPRLQQLVGQLYSLGAPATSAQLREISERWRPMRTWVAVLVRAAGPRLLGPRWPAR